MNVLCPDPSNKLQPFDASLLKARTSAEKDLRQWHADQKDKGARRPKKEDAKKKEDIEWRLQAINAGYLPESYTRKKLGTKTGSKGPANDKTVARSLSANVQSHLTTAVPSGQPKVNCLCGFVR